VKAWRGDGYQRKTSIFLRGDAKAERARLAWRRRVGCLWAVTTENGGRTGLLRHSSACCACPLLPFCRGHSWPGDRRYGRQSWRCLPLGIFYGDLICTAFSGRRGRRSFYPWYRRHSFTRGLRRAALTRGARSLACATAPQHSPARLHWRHASRAWLARCATCWRAAVVRRAWRRRCFAHLHCHAAAPCLPMCDERCTRPPYPCLYLAGAAASSLNSSTVAGVGVGLRWKRRRRRRRGISRLLMRGSVFLIRRQLRLYCPLPCAGTRAFLASNTTL